MNYLSQNLTHTQETVPYTQEGEIRTFNQDTSEDELVWHRDREDRIHYLRQIGSSSLITRHR